MASLRTCSVTILSPSSSVLVAYGTHFSHDPSLKWFTERLAVDPAAESHVGNRCDNQTMKEGSYPWPSSPGDSVDEESCSQDFQGMESVNEHKSMERRQRPVLSERGSVGVRVGSADERRGMLSPFTCAEEKTLYQI